MGNARSSPNYHHADSASAVRPEDSDDNARESRSRAATGSVVCGGGSIDRSREANAAPEDKIGVFFRNVNESTGFLNGFGINTGTNQSSSNHPVHQSSSTFFSINSSEDMGRAGFGSIASSSTPSFSIGQSKDVFKPKQSTPFLPVIKRNNAPAMINAHLSSPNDKATASSSVVDPPQQPGAQNMLKREHFHSTSNVVSHFQWPPTKRQEIADTTQSVNKLAESSDNAALTGIQNIHSFGRAKSLESLSLSASNQTSFSFFKKDADDNPHVLSNISNDKGINTSSRRSSLTNGLSSNSNRMQHVKNTRTLPPSSEPAPSVVFLSPPLGLMGPSSFEFSPPLDRSTCTSPLFTPKSSRAPLYLSFVSCAQHMDAMSKSANNLPAAEPWTPLTKVKMSSSNESANNTTFDLRGKASGTRPTGKTGTNSSHTSAVERALYVLPLDPILAHLECQAISDSLGNDTITDTVTGEEKEAEGLFTVETETERSTAALQRRSLAAQLAGPLIQYSVNGPGDTIPNSNHSKADFTANFNISKVVKYSTTSHDQKALSVGLSRQPPHPHNSAIKGESDATLSLQERLRRERQRLVWNIEGEKSGITQFSWTRIQKKHKRSGDNDGSCSLCDLAHEHICDTNESAEAHVTGDPTKTELNDLLGSSVDGWPIKPKHHLGCHDSSKLCLLVPLNGDVYIQEGVSTNDVTSGQRSGTIRPLAPIYEKRKMAWDLYYTKWWEDVRRENRLGRKREKCIISGCSEECDSVVKDTSSSFDWGNDVEEGGDNCIQPVENDGRQNYEHDFTVEPPQIVSASVEDFLAAMESTDLGSCSPGRDLSAVDPQLSPDGTMVAFVVAGEIYVVACNNKIALPSANILSDVTIVNDDDCVAEDGCESNNTFLEEPAPKNRPQCHFPMELQQRMPIRITYGSATDDGYHLDPFYRELPITCLDKFRGAQDKLRGGGLTRNKSTCSQHITHGLADFVSQEEMDRYRGFWWSPDSKGILFTRVDESMVPPYRIMHEGRKPSSQGLSAWGLGGGRSRANMVPSSVGPDASMPGRHGDNEDLVYEDHRYPFAGKANPSVTLGYIEINRKVILEGILGCGCVDTACTPITCGESLKRSTMAAREQWSSVLWFKPPPEASEYLARVSWLPDGSACAQWQNRQQSILQLMRMDLQTGEEVILLTERSNIWINLHNMFRTLPRPIHPNECCPKPMIQTRRTKGNKAASEAANAAIPCPLPPGSFSFIFASERTGFSHLYLYTYVLGSPHGATLLRAISGGDWVVESIVGIDAENDVVYVTGTYDSPLEKHLYAMPITNRFNRTNLHSSSLWAQSDPNLSNHSGATVFAFPPNPVKLTKETGMHNIVMDESCSFFVDTSSDLDRATSSKVYCISPEGPFRRASNMETNFTHYNATLRLLFVLYNSETDDVMSIADSVDNVALGGARNKRKIVSKLVPPKLMTFKASNEVDTLYGALYLPEQSIHGPGPYPLICSVYGGPHVQRVNRSWSSMTADMRAQRLAALGFVVLKCDNRGSSRRGLGFEGAIKRRLGRLEVFDQVAAVKQLVAMGIADESRVGIYGWSYGGYLAAMCLCRAPDIFHCAVAGAPVTSWDGYDTHYTERYMGLPDENAEGYSESSLFAHVANLRGKLMLVHGLIDENVHFRHTARLINHLVAEGKDYDLMVFPDERHSPRRLCDRLYMEKKICEYFVRNLVEHH